MKPTKNSMRTVYQVWYETYIGPTFSTRQKAEEWLTKNFYDDEDAWRESLEMTGYPIAVEIVVDDTSKDLMDR